jgi:hypothetical protein
MHEAPRSRGTYIHAAPRQTGKTTWAIAQAVEDARCGRAVAFVSKFEKVAKTHALLRAGFDGDVTYSTAQNIMLAPVFGGTVFIATQTEQLRGRRLDVLYLDDFKLTDLRSWQGFAPRVCVTMTQDALYEPRKRGVDTTIVASAVLERHGVISAISRKVPAKRLAAGLSDLVTGKEADELSSALRLQGYLELLRHFECARGWQEGASLSMLPYP